MNRIGDGFSTAIQFLNGHVMDYSGRYLPTNMRELKKNLSHNMSTCAKMSGILLNSSVLSGLALGLAGLATATSCSSQNDLSTTTQILTTTGFNDDFNNYLSNTNHHASLLADGSWFFPDTPDTLDTQMNDDVNNYVSNTNHHASLLADGSWFFPDTPDNRMNDNYNDNLGNDYSHLNKKLLGFGAASALTLIVTVKKIIDNQSKKNNFRSVKNSSKSVQKLVALTLQQALLLGGSGIGEGLFINSLIDPWSQVSTNSKKAMITSMILCFSEALVSVISNCITSSTKENSDPQESNEITMPMLKALANCPSSIV